MISMQAKAHAHSCRERTHMLHYTAPDSTRYPLTEADYNIAFKVYRSDRKRAKKNDPHACWYALGIRRDSDVEDCYIGSGKDAYVIFKGRGRKSPFAVHFIIRTAERRFVDHFDKDKSVKTMMIILYAPPETLKLAHRRASNKRRRSEINSGTGKPVRKRGTIAKRRVQRIGVTARPRAKITGAGDVSMQQLSA